MKKIILLLSPCAFPFFCNASGEVNAEYSITSLYSGLIGNNSITMSLTASTKTVSGSYIYNKFQKEILLNGISSSNSIILNEKLGDGTAVINIKPKADGYKGQWCGKKCLPITLSSHDSFRYGPLNGVKISDSGNGSYELKIEFKNKLEKITLPESIDIPTIDFMDINGDGFYDIIARADHRPNNGSQDVYIFTGKDFVKNKILSNVNGTLTYKPFTKAIVFNSKDDCCERYSKIIYSYDNSQLVKIKSMSFDYSNSKGRSENSSDVPKATFESY